MTASRRIQRRSWLRVLRTPALLLVLSCAGLVLALTADGATDMVAAILLATPLIALLGAWRRASRSSTT